MYGKDRIDSLVSLPLAYLGSILSVHLELAAPVGADGAAEI